MNERTRLAAGKVDLIERKVCPGQGLPRLVIRFDETDVGGKLESSAEAKQRLGIPAGAEVLDIVCEVVRMKVREEDPAREVPAPAMAVKQGPPRTRLWKETKDESAISF